MLKHYKFRGKVWKHEGQSGWYFISLPKLISQRIRRAHLDEEEGWGRLKAMATVGRTHWKTSIWFDTKRGRYLLPIKKEIRIKAKVSEGSIQTVKLEIDRPRIRTSIVIAYARSS